MAHTDSKEKDAARGKMLGKVLSIPGVVGEPIWQELASEAETYLRLYKRLSQELLDAKSREVLENEMIMALSHLTVHSQVLYTSIDEIIENEVLSHDDGLNERFSEESEQDLAQLYESGSSAQQDIIEFWIYLNERTQNYGSQLRTQRVKIERINALGNSKLKKAAKVNKILDDIEKLVVQYTAEINFKLPKYRADVSRYVSAYSRIIFWATDRIQKRDVQKEELLEALKSFRETLSEVEGGFSELISNIQNTAHSVSTTYDHKGLIKALDNLVLKLIGVLDTVRELDTFTEDTIIKLERE